MPTEPTKLPEWATTDVVDGTSGENNVAEPSAAKKLRGWDREEIPPRQWWNWLGRLTNEWVEWFQGTTIPLSITNSTLNEQKTDVTGHTHEITGIQVTDFKTSLTYHSAAFANGSEEFDVLTIPENVDHTVGPTGSGADYIWTALDELPLTATHIDVSCTLFVSTTTAIGQCWLFVNLKDATSTAQMQMTNRHYRANTGDDEQVNALGTVLLDSSNIFTCLWDDFHGNITSSVVNLRLLGFGNE